MAEEQQNDAASRGAEAPVSVSEVFYGGERLSVGHTTDSSRREATYGGASHARPVEQSVEQIPERYVEQPVEQSADSAEQSVEQSAELPHHHHHHHHHDLSASGVEGSPALESPSSSASGSGRSGRQHRRSRRSRKSTSPEERETHNVIFPTLGMSPVTVAFMGALIAFIILAPVITVLILREHAMQKRLLATQTSLGLEMEKCERLAAERDKAIAERDAARAARASAAEALPPPAPPAAAIPEINIDGLLSGAETNDETNAEAQLPPTPAERLGVSEEEVGKIRLASELLPNGNRMVADLAGNPAPHADAFRTQIEEAYAALAARSNAVEAFEALVEKLPRWPYGHLYLALAKGDAHELTNAVPRFEAVRVVNPDLQEAALYRAMLALFQADNMAADHELDALPVREEGDPNPLALGPLYVPYYAPERLKLKFARRAGLPSVKEVDWVQR